MILDFIFGSIWSALGTTAIIVLLCFAVAWFVPPLRPYAVAVAGAVLVTAAAYTRGYRARADLENRRKEEAVRKAQDEYAKIDNRPDGIDDVVKRLRNSGF